jgi:hypothetical protein
VEWRGGHTAGVATVTVEMGGYSSKPDRLAVSSRLAKLIKSLRFRTCGRLYLEDTLLEWLPQDLEDMAAARGPYIQAAHAVAGQRHFARPRRVAPADQPHTQDGLRGSATYPSGHGSPREA